MNFTYLIVYMLNCKHHMQLGPNDSVSFPAVCGVNKVYFENSYEIQKSTFHKV